MGGTFGLRLALSGRPPRSQARGRRKMTGALAAHRSERFHGPLERVVRGHACYHVRCHPFEVPWICWLQHPPCPDHFVWVAGLPFDTKRYASESRKYTCRDSWLAQYLRTRTERSASNLGFLPALQWPCRYPRLDR